MAKSESGKKVKKPSDNKDGGPNKKLKTSDSSKDRKIPPQQEFTMTIPRKKDKDKKSKLVEQQQQQPKELPKIPKKSDKKSDKTPEKEILGTIPKKNKDKPRKESQTNDIDDKKGIISDIKEAEKTAAVEKDSSKPTKETTSSKKSVKTEKQSNNKLEKLVSSNDKSEKQASGKSEKEGASKSDNQGPVKSERRGSIKSEKQGATSSKSEKEEKPEKQGSSSGSEDDSPLKKTTSKSDKERPSNKSGKDKPKNKSEKETSKSDKDKSTKKSDKPKPLKIDTSVVGTANADPTKGKSPLPSGTAMDTHPYARASVIEVLHGVEDPTEDGWWSEDSDEEAADKTKQSIRLCDIIDRVSIGDKKWRYYVHYRDFNRRMDEWVSMERIVSPPSVGNAKARAIKKEEERQKRKQQRLEERSAELRSGIDVSAPRASRRRSSMNQPLGVAADATAAVEGDAETPRRTRLQRKKSMDDDTVVASNQNEKSGSGRDTPHDALPLIVMAAEKGIVVIPTQAATHTIVGEHVVATIPAQELDEHEGLDEASLREHEEVTKVKNVAFVELGASQMETWYFSPLPKELLSERGLVEVLYVCEFTFSLFSRKSELRRFQYRLPSHARHPPGNEIYRNGNLSSEYIFFLRGFQR
jgi:hypothetical protein